MAPKLDEHAPRSPEPSRPTTPQQRVHACPKNLWLHPSVPLFTPFRGTHHPSPKTTTHLSHARHASLNLPAASSATPTPWRASPTVAAAASAPSAAAVTGAPCAPALASPPPPAPGGSSRPPLSPATAAAAAAAAPTPASEGESSPCFCPPPERGGPPWSSENVPDFGAEEEEDQEEEAAAAMDALYSRSAVSCLPSSSAWSARIWRKNIFECAI